MSAGGPRGGTFLYVCCERRVGFTATAGCRPYSSSVTAHHGGRVVIAGADVAPLTGVAELAAVTRPRSGAVTTRDVRIDDKSRITANADPCQVGPSPTPNRGLATAIRGLTGCRTGSCPPILFIERNGT
jgi:hypothetical protein